MHAKLPMLLVFVSALGCSAPPPAQHARAPGPRPAQADHRSAAPAPLAAEAPAETLAEADRAYDLQLSASRGQFDEDRQIAVLEEAILLYGQFLERADGRPELEPAVRKSRERIADAQATIEFLRSNRQPPAARTE